MEINHSIIKAIIVVDNHKMEKEKEKAYTENKIQSLFSQSSSHDKKQKSQLKFIRLNKLIK